MEIREKFVFKADPATSIPTPMNRLTLILTALILTTSSSQAEFVHPGLLHTREDISRMRVAVTNKQKPIIDGFGLLAQHPNSQSDFQLKGPFESAGRRPTIHDGETRSDAQAAYHNALMWAITGERAHAKKAIEILDAWSARHKRITGLDGVLLAGLQGIKFANAAEILRYTEAGWPEADIIRCEQWFREAWLPVIVDYATFANCNWDTAALQTKMAIAIFCNDREMFEDTVRYAVDGAGNGSITNAIPFPTGQAQETTRKQHYAQLGLGLLCNAAEMAWNQGVDLYGWSNNRILRGMEYNAAYGLGENAPYQPYLDRTGKYGFGGKHQPHDKISPISRGTFTPIFAQPYHHYVKRRGLKAPSLEKVAQKTRPEGCSGDQVGLGTLTHWRHLAPRKKALRAPGVPAGFVARGIPQGVRITWVPSVDPIANLNASSYQILRASRREGPYQEIGSVNAGHQFEDRNVERGRVRFYVVKAKNQIGSSVASLPFAACAGLPARWASRDIGAVGVPGSSQFNGQSFRLEAEGHDIGGKSDQFQFAYAPMTGDGTITARIASAPNSGWAKLGVMMRESLDPDSSHVSAMLLPPFWKVGLVARKVKGAETITSGTSEIGEPYVIKKNRLMKPYWLRLTRRGNSFTASSSPDGTNWQTTDRVEVPMQKSIYLGLPACSQLPKVTTTITYDHVSIPGWKMPGRP